jgi:hypothetical protein
MRSRSESNGDLPDRPRSHRQCRRHPAWLAPRKPSPLRPQPRSKVSQRASLRSCSSDGSPLRPQPRSKVSQSASLRSCTSDASPLRPQLRSKVSQSACLRSCTSDASPLRPQLRSKVSQSASPQVLHQRRHTLWGGVESKLNVCSSIHQPLPSGVMPHRVPLRPLDLAILDRVSFFGSRRMNVSALFQDALARAVAAIDQPAQEDMSWPEAASAGASGRSLLDAAVFCGGA